MIVTALVNKEDLARLSNDKISALERVLVREILDDKHMSETLAAKLKSAAK